MLLLNTSKTKNYKQIAVWLFVIWAMVFVMIPLGGLTRLTDSGLSITKWKLVIGTFPPLDESSWQKEFEEYQKSPQYKNVNSWMKIDDFKSIYWLEFIHRLWGRLIGMTFFFGFLYFLISGKLKGESSLITRLILIFCLLSFQGLMGWIMVKSGLVGDMTKVRHYELTAHLTLALLFYSVVVWHAFKLWNAASDPLGEQSVSRFRKPAYWLTGFIGLTTFTGGFVAGLRACAAHQTFPLMDGYVLHPGLINESMPFFKNFLDNVTMVQFEHRVLASIVALLIFYFWYKVFKSELPQKVKYIAHILLAIVWIQISLGVATLLTFAPGEMQTIVLGTVHQMGAIVLLTISLIMNFMLRKS